MFKLNESKSFVLISKNIPTTVVNFEKGIFLESFLAWSRDYLIEKKQQIIFKNNILRHCGPNSTYTGRQNILEQLAAIYQFVKTINPLETDLLRSIVSRIEERALHCTPGFETGICDLAQDLLYTPQSLDELLQTVRQDIVKKAAIGMTSDVHGHNQVFSFAAAHYAVPLLNPGDPYLGQLNQQLVEKILAKRFHIYYHSVNLIAELNEQFFLVLQSFGYAEYKIEPGIHTKIKNFILTIFSHHPLVQQLQQAEVYLKTKEDIQKSALNQIAQLLNQRGLFDLPKDEQDSRLRDLQHAEVPEWLPQSLHEEFIELSKIEAQNFKQAALFKFIENHKLFQIEEYHQNLKTRAASGISKFMQPSIKQWLNTLIPEIHEEIKAINQHAEAQITILEVPLHSLDEATSALDECFWVSEESHEFPYQQLKLNEIRKAFYYELIQNQYIQSHPLIERVIFATPEEINDAMIDIVSQINYEDSTQIVNFFALVQMYTKNLEQGFYIHFYQSMSQVVEQFDEIQVKKLIAFLIDFKIEIPFTLISHHKVLGILAWRHLPLMLRCMKETAHQLDLIAAFYARAELAHNHSYHQAILASLIPEFKLEFIEKYRHEFILDMHSLMATLKHVPRENRFQLFQHFQGFFLINLNDYEGLLDLFPSQDHLPFCQLMQARYPQSFNKVGLNRIIMEKLDISQRFLYVSTILDRNQPEFSEIVVKIFKLLDTEERKSFLSSPHFFAKMACKDFAKILLRTGYSETEKLHVLDVYLAQQSVEFEGDLLIELEGLFEKMSLSAAFILDRYTPLMIEHSYIEASVFNRVLSRLEGRERFKFLINLPQYLKSLIIQNQLVGDMMQVLLPENKQEYLRHFGLPLPQMITEERNLINILKQSDIDVRQGLLEELKPHLGKIITSGSGLSNLVCQLVDLYHQSQTACIKSLIVDFGIGEHIKTQFFSLMHEFSDTSFNELVSILGPNIIKIIDNHDLSELFSGCQKLPLFQERMIQFLQGYSRDIKPKNIQEFIQSMAKISNKNRNIFVTFMLEHLTKYPISFGDFFEFLCCKGLSAKFGFMAALTREHFSGDEQDLSFPALIEKISTQLDRKLSIQLLTIFSSELPSFIRTPIALQQILRNLLYKDQMTLMNQFRSHFSEWFNSFDAIEQTLTLLRHPQSCLIFMQLQGPGLIGFLQEDVLKTCNLLGLLPVEKQLFFLSQCRFSTAQLSAIQSQSLLSPLIRVYVDLTVEEMGLSTHRFFDASYSSLIQNMKGILIQPQRYTIDEIHETIQTLPPALNSQIDTEEIMTYLLEREPEPRAKKAKK